MGQGRSYLISVSRFLLVSTIVVVVAFHAWRNIRTIEVAELHLAWFPAILSSVLLALAALVGSVILGVLFNALGFRISAKTAFVLGTVPVLGRFVPGRIHSMIGLVWLARELAGVPARVSFAVGSLYALHIPSVSLVASVFFLPFIPRELNIRLPLLLGAGVAIAVAHPVFLLGPANRILRLLARNTIDESPPYRTMMGLLGIGVLQRCGAALAFGLLAGSIVPIPGPEAFLGISISFVLATVVGYLAVFTPAGLGVQEGALMWLLAAYVPPPHAALLTLAARAWQTLVVLALGGMGALTMRLGAGASDRAQPDRDRVRRPGEYP